jgi:2-iminobutanoate/2-iminopropanoate deaminase
MLFVSGQLGIDPVSGELKDGVGLQTEQALENLKEVIGAAGAGLDSVVKVTLYLASMSDFAEVNRIYAGYFDAPYPARAAFEVARLPLDALVEIEAIALLEEERP